MLSLAVNKNSFRNVEKIKCFSKFNVKFHQVHTDNLIILIKWITLLIFITTTPLCKYTLISILDFQFSSLTHPRPHFPLLIFRRSRTLWCCCFFHARGLLHSFFCAHVNRHSSNTQRNKKRRERNPRAWTRKGIRRCLVAENLSLNRKHKRTSRQRRNV